MKIDMNRKWSTVIPVILFISMVAGILSSCASSGLFSGRSGNKYFYTYRLTTPVESTTLFYSDERIIVQFRFDDGAIQLRLQNMYHENMRIDWTQASIGVRGRYSPVRHAANVYNQELLYTLSNIIPPSGYTQDFVLPMENVSYDGKNWRESDLLHTMDYNSPQFVRRIRENVGSTINLLLPLVFESDEKLYSFSFSVDRVDRIPWDRYNPPSRPVKAPGEGPSDGSPSIENLSVALMVTGMIGISVFLLSMKKSSPRE
jgi:hypothetical protein